MPTFALENEMLLAVTLAGEAVHARRGSMIAVKGDVAFSRVSDFAGGVAKAALRAATDESLELMKAQGTGTVYYGVDARRLKIITLDGGTLHVEARRLLALDPRLRTETIFQGSQGAGALLRGMVSGQGMFTTTVAGHGQVVLAAHGDGVELPLKPPRTLYVDPNAHLGHEGDLESSMAADVNWKTRIGQASGESYQLKFTGQGRIFIQTSEV